MANSLCFSESSGRLWERTPVGDATGQLLRLVPPQRQKIVSAVFAASGDWLAVSDSRGTLFQVDLSRNRYKTIARGCNGVSSLCIVGGDPEEIAVACSSCCVFIYQVTGRLQGTLKGHRAKIVQIGVNAGRGMMLTCSEDACILWQLSNWSRVRSLFSDKSPFIAGIFAPSGRSILTCFSQGDIYQWSLQDFSLEKTLSHAPNLAFSALTSVHTTAGDYFIAAGLDGKLTLWDAEGSATPVGTITAQKATQLLPLQGGKVVVLSTYGTILLVDVKERRAEEWSARDPKVTFLATDAKGTRMVAIDEQGSARLLLGPNAPQDSTVPRNTVASKRAEPSPQGAQPADDSSVQLMTDAERESLDHTDPSALRLKDLRALLMKYGEFPDKYRVSIWQTVLQLPGNEEAFAALAGKGIHQAYASLNEKYPIKSQKLFAQLQRTLSALSHWSPVFAESEIIPSIAFPIVALAGGQEITCFELLASLFLNWLQHWFEFYPNPPVSYLQSCDSVLSRQDAQVAEHLRSLVANTGQVFWPLLCNLLTEVLTREEWIVMMDHLVMDWEEPMLLLHFVVQYLLSYKSTLLSIHTADNLSHFLHKQNPCSVVKLMRKARASLRRLDLNRDLTVQFVRRVPLLPGSYPPFSAYPQFEVQFQAEVRKRIRQEADEALRKQTYLEDLSNHLTDLEEKERVYRNQQEALLQMDHDRRSAAAIASATSLEEKKRVDEEMRIRRLQQLRQVQETIEKSLDAQLEARRTELMRLEQEIAERRQQDQYFLQKKIQDEALARLEFQSAQKMYELTRGRVVEDEQRKLREQIDTWKREQELKERLLHEQWTLEDEERRLKLETIKERKLKEMEALTLANDRKKLEMQQQLQALEKEVRTQDVLRERKLRSLQEEEALRTAEALEKLTKAQTVIQQEEQVHFKTLLAEERRQAERRTKERLDLLEMERGKQLTDMQELEEEIQHLQKRQQRIEVEDRLAELRHEQEMKTLAEERQVQEMLLRIDEERRVKAQLEREMRMKEEELREKTEFQQVLRTTEDRVLREERARFEEHRAALRREQEEEEAAKANAHNLKMETIIREREKQLLEITQARRAVQLDDPRRAAQLDNPRRAAQPDDPRSRSALNSRIDESVNESRSRGVNDSRSRDSRSRAIDESHSHAVDESHSHAADDSHSHAADDSHSRAGNDSRSRGPAEPLRRRDSPPYRDDLLHDTFSRNEGQFERADEEPRSSTSPGRRSMSPGEEGERVISHHDSEHRRQLRHASSPGSYTASSSYVSESSHIESYSSGGSSTPPLPDRYESSYSSGLSSQSHSISESSWSHSDHSPPGEPVRRSHYY